MNKRNCKKLEFMRWIDKILHSFWGQIAGLFGLAVLSFGLLSIPVIFSEKLTFSDNLFSFVNPGSTFEQEMPAFERGWAFFVGFAGMILLCGLLISVFNNILQSRIDKVNKGQVHYRFRKHALIIGYNKMTISLIRQLAGKYDEIVLQTTRNVPEVRHELDAVLDEKVKQNVTIVLGSRTSEEDLRKLRPEFCEEIFLLGETDEYDHDSANIKCLDVIKDILNPYFLKIKKISEKIETNDKEIKRLSNKEKPTVEEKNRELLREKEELLQKEKEELSQKEKEFIASEIAKPCYVLFEYQSTYAIFQRQEAKEFTLLNVEPFNMEEMWARKVFVNGKYLKDKNYPPLDYKAITPQSDEYVHLVVVGASRMGVAMAIEAARIGHYANFCKQKTRITIIDAAADEQMNILRSRYSAFMEAIEVKFNEKRTEWCGELEDYMYVTLDFIEGRIENEDIRKMLADWSDDKQRLLTIAVCLPHPPASLAVGLYLPDKIYANNVPVLIYQETSGNILHSFNSKGLYKNVFAFGMTSEGYETALHDDLIPQYVQYIYYNAQNFEDKPFPDKTDPNFLKNWINAGVVEKWSNRYNADTIPTKLRAAGIDISNFEKKTEKDKVQWENYDKLETLLAEMEHNRWNVERLLAGYRYFNEARKQTVFDAIKDESLKNKIENLYTNKDNMLRNTKTGEDKTQSELKNEIDESKKIIKTAKDIIKAAFYHECIAPYALLSNTDKFYDIAIVRGTKWIINNLYQQKNTES